MSAALGRRDLALSIEGIFAISQKGLWRPSPEYFSRTSRQAASRDSREVIQNGGEVMVLVMQIDVSTISGFTVPVARNNSGENIKF